MRTILITTFVLASSGAFAQDLSMCTSLGNSVRCCRQSVAEHGAFGSSFGQSKANRQADMAACMAAENGKKK
ncbi:hypothetical protein UP06_29405 [Bradyrhizobium sp. LTSP857]|nr:hypothetical protein UP06_29405 [Bradyrhizobium sp. LTSP857]